MSEISRRALYKNNDRDFETQRRNRNDHSVEIRKAKKEDQFQKRRNIDLDETCDTSPVKEKSKVIKEITINDVPKLLAGSNMQQKIEAATSCRRQLSKVHDPPIEAFYKNGTIPQLVKCLQSNPTEEVLIFESAWALTNIASGESKHTAAVVESGAVPVLLSLMEHPSNQIAEQSIWTLSNIAGDSAEYRDLLVSLGAVPALKHALTRFRHFTDVLRQACWFVSNVCRHRSNKYPQQAILELLPAVHELLVAAACDKTGSSISNIRSDLCWALAYASDGRSTILDAMVDNELLNVLCHILNDPSCPADVVTPALRAVGNAVAGEDRHADAALRCGAIECLNRLLSHSLPRIVKETCWVISNITAGTEQQVDLLVNSGIMLRLLNVLKSADYKSQKEAAWAVSNMTNSKKTAHKIYLLNNNVFEAIVPMMRCDDNKIVMLLLDTVRELFNCANNLEQLEECINVFEGCGGVDVIEDLQNHESVDIYNKSYDLVKEFLGGEEDDNDNEEEHVNSEKYAF